MRLADIWQTQMLEREFGLRLYHSVHFCLYVSAQTHTLALTLEGMVFDRGRLTEPSCEWAGDLAQHAPACGGL